MKKLLTPLIVILLMTSKGISQTYNDTLVSIPKSKLQKAINIIEKSKVMESEIMGYKSIVDIYKQKIQSTDSIITAYKTKEDNYKKIFYNQEQKSLNDNNIIYNLTSNVNIKNSQLRKKAKAKWAFLAIGTILGFLISK